MDAAGLRTVIETMAETGQNLALFFLNAA